jgi:hypothetical protein
LSKGREKPRRQPRKPPAFMLTSKIRSAIAQRGGMGQLVSLDAEGNEAVFKGDIRLLNGHKVEILPTSTEGVRRPQMIPLSQVVRVDFARA